MSPGWSCGFRRCAGALIAFSVLVCVASVVLDVGIHRTPYETTDSAGRGMGFNDPLSSEHFRILLSHFHPAAVLDPAYAYTWCLLGMHGFGVWLLMFSRQVTVKTIRWFFGLQAVLFPFGWIGFLILPLTIHSLVKGTLDREGIIDVPFVAVTAQPVWIAASLVIFAISWKLPAEPKADPPPEIQ